MSTINVLQWGSENTKEKTMTIALTSPDLTIDTEASAAYLPLQPQDVVTDSVHLTNSCILDFHHGELIGVEFLLPVTVTVHKIMEVYQLDEEQYGAVVVALLLLSDQMISHLVAD